MGQGFKFDLKQKGAGLKAVEKAIAELKHGGAYVKVGVIGSKATSDHGGITNAELAAVHEYGTQDGRIPARSWIGSSYRANEAKYFETLKTLLGQVVEGKQTVKKSLDLIGLMASTDIKNGVTAGDGVPPPLKPATIAAKGSSRPLIDTGRMVNSVSWAVKLGSGGGEE